MKKYILIFLLCLSFPVFAADKSDKKQSLQEVEAQVEAEKAKQAQIGDKMKSLVDDMKGLKTNLIETTGKVQKNEQQLDGLEKKLSTLTVRKKELTDNLDKDKESLAELITALERIRRLPPEALIARPGAPLQTAQASVILGAIMPELNKRAEDFKNRLTELENVEQDLAANHEKLKTSSEQLKQNKEKMEDMVSKRQDVIKQTQTEYEGQTKQVAELSHQASDLKDLIQKIEADRAKREHEKADTKIEGKKRKNKVDENELGGSLASLGNARLPIPGVVTIKYGQPDDLGAASEGIHINARPGSVVVAPMKGVVRYAGPFKSYGSIILLEHKNNYHSLIAGLGRIDTVVGQSVDAGEPLGTLGSTPSLYYELRFNGQPIDPARKLPI